MKLPATSPSDTASLRDLVAAAARIETRQAAYEEVAHRVLDTLKIQNEKLDAILEAATRDSGPSPVAEALAAILSSLREQESLLVDLPGALIAAMRDEFRRGLDGDENDPAIAPGSWRFAERTGEGS